MLWESHSQIPQGCQVDERIIGGLGDPNLRVGGGHEAFGGCDVRSPF